MQFRHENRLGWNNNLNKKLYWWTYLEMHSHHNTLYCTWNLTLNIMSFYGKNFWTLFRHSHDVSRLIWNHHEYIHSVTSILKNWLQKLQVCFLPFPIIKIYSWLRSNIFHWNYEVFRNFSNSFLFLWNFHSCYTTYQSNCDSLSSGALVTLIITKPWLLDERKT